MIRHVELTESNKQWQHPWHLVRRVHLHEELKCRAMSRDGHGVPVTLRLQSRVTQIDTASSTATLESGECVRGDVLIGADGVHVGFSFGHIYIYISNSRIIIPLTVDFSASPDLGQPCPAAISSPGHPARARFAFSCLGSEHWKIQKQHSLPNEMASSSSGSASIDVSSCIRVRITGSSILSAYIQVLRAGPWVMRMVSPQNLGC